MKKIILILFTVILNPVFADVDLDLELPFQNSVLMSEAVTKPSIDLSDGFPDIRSQKPLGACQSYAMAAWLDYIFYFKTGQVADFSEKAMAYGLLSFFIDEFWDAQAQQYPKGYLGKEMFLSGLPTLGNGIAPFMIEAYLKYGVIPNGVYSFGNLLAEQGVMQIDHSLYTKYFESEDRYKRDEYLTKLDETFFSKPPENFIYKMKNTDFHTGKEEVLEIKSVKQLTELIGVSRDNVMTYYNKDYVNYLTPIPKQSVKELQEYFQTVSNHFKHRNKIVSGENLKKQIKASLDRRMAVMLAATVWAGDWATNGIPFFGGGGHAMVVVGYQERDGRLYFKLRNSWGKDKLIDGYNYVDEDTIKASTLYIVTHE